MRAATVVGEPLHPYGSKPMTAAVATISIVLSCSRGHAPIMRWSGMVDGRPATCRLCEIPVSEAAFEERTLSGRCRIGRRRLVAQIELWNLTEVFAGHPPTNAAGSGFLCPRAPRVPRRASCPPHCTPPPLPHRCRLVRATAAPQTYDSQVMRVDGTMTFRRHTGTFSLTRSDAPPAPGP